MAKTQEFSLGDVVQTIGGGPRMTVAGSWFEEHKRYTVLWFDSEQKLQHADILGEILVLCEEPDVEVTPSKSPGGDGWNSLEHDAHRTAFLAYRDGMGPAKAP